MKYRSYTNYLNGIIDVIMKVLALLLYGRRGELSYCALTFALARQSISAISYILLHQGRCRPVVSLTRTSFTIVIPRLLLHLYDDIEISSF